MHSSRLWLIKDENQRICGRIENRSTHRGKAPSWVLVMSGNKLYLQDWASVLKEYQMVLERANE